MKKESDIKLDIDEGDILLGGRFKNKRVEVKSLGRDELGQPTFNNGRKLLSVRIEKKLPDDKKSSKTKDLEKEANGDMVAYFRDNPNKLKEKLLRDKKKSIEKTSSMLPSIKIMLKRLESRIGKKPEKVEDESSEFRESINGFLSHHGMMKSSAETKFKTNPNPTQGQIEAGNYKKGHIKYDGMDITIENTAGSNRSGVDKDGVEWKSKMNHHYGYIKRTLGKDGDHVDVFINPGTKSTDMVYIVNQYDPSTKKFDEHKCMLGFESISEAKKAYLSNYDKDWKGLKSIIPMKIEDFKNWVYRGRKSKPIDKQMSKTAYLRNIKSYAVIDEILKSNIMGIL